MGSLIRPYFEALLLLLLAAGFYTLAATGRLGVVVVAAGSLAFVVRALLLARGIRPRIPPRWIAAATLLYALFYAADVYLLSRSFIDATAHLVVFIAILKLFSAQQGRDYVYLCIIALLEILSAATLTVSGGFLVFFVLFLLLMVATFVAFEVFRAEERAPVVARSQTGAPRVLRRSLFGYSLLLAVGVVLFGGVIFLLLPRTSLGNWTPPVPRTGVSGFSDEVSLGDISRLQQSDQPVMHVRILGSRPPMDAAELGQVRWRGRVLSIFDGRRWYSPLRGTMYPTTLGRLELYPMPYPGEQRQLLHYSITLEPIGSEVLFFPSQLLEADTHFHALGVDSSGTVTSPGREFGGTIYSGVSDLALPPAQYLRRAGVRYPARIRRGYLQLPSAIDPRVMALARRITARSRTPYGRMQALTEYLRSHYGYTLQDLPGGPDPLANFLFTRKAGDCEYFASALALMGRTLGVPTRVVNGFVTGQYNDISDEYVIRGRDAHSWVEAWFPLGDRGVWMPFDATPSTLDGGGPWNRAMLYLDALSSTWQEWVINYDWLHQLRLAHQMQQHVERHAERARDFLMNAPERWQTWLSAWRRRAGSNGWKILLILAGLAGAGLGLGPLTRWLRGWRLRLRDSGAARSWSRHQASLGWQRLQRLLGRSGFVREPSETAEEFAARLKPAPLRTAVEAYISHYQIARFGHRSPDWETLERQYLEVKRRLRQSRSHSE